MNNILVEMLNPDGSIHTLVNRDNVPVSRLGASGRWEFPVGLQAFSVERLGRVQSQETAQNTESSSLYLGQPVFNIEGTFGTRTKCIDGNTYTGKRVTRDLINFVVYYFTQNLEATQNPNVGIVEMAFHDFRANTHWVVVPLSQPKEDSSSREPLRSKYTWTLQGVRHFDKSATLPSDPVSTALSPATPNDIAKSFVA